MKGVAVSYGLDPGDDLYDTSYLGYGAGPAGCSMIFFPGTTTTSGHAMYFRNMDYFTVTGPELAENAPSAGRARMCSKNYVLEMYPDRGYPSLVIGSFDLLNAPLDGINAQGVTVSMLVDNDAAPVTVTDLNKAPGLSSFQLMRAVLDTAADTREAKAIIMNNTVSMLAVPLHALVADRSGRSFIAEMSDKDFQWHFTDNNNTPQILTNHAVYKYPTTGTFPDVLASDEYDSFNRYRKPDAYINRHLQKFSPEDAFFSMRLVYASTELAMEGGSRPLPMRTVWTSVLDLEDRSATVRFYLGDAGKDRPAGSPPLVFFGLLRFALME
jgi:hypothetical protein